MRNTLDGQRACSLAQPDHLRVLAHQAYAAYWLVFGASYEPPPPLDKMSPLQQRAWEAAAQAVLDAWQAQSSLEPREPQDWPYRYRIGNRVYWDADRTHIYTITRREVDCTRERPLRFLYRLSRNGVPLDWVEESMLHPVPDEV